MGTRETVSYFLKHHLFLIGMFFLFFSADIVREILEMNKATASPM